MLPSKDLGQLAIVGDSPTGQDPKEFLEYEIMSAEIAKISSIQGESAVDWQSIEKATVVILQEHSKDIKTATYLTAALMQRHGCEGWCVGTRILIDILSLWWESAFPPLKRLKARTNIIDWWHERSVLFFSTCKEIISSELSKEMKDCISEMDAIVEARLPDAMPVFRLGEAVRRISVIAPPVLVEDTVALAENSNTTNQETPKAQQPVNTISQITPPTDVGSGKILLCTTAQQYCNMCFGTKKPEDLTDALTWKAFYISIWGKIHKLPPRENLQTLLPSPDTVRIDAFFTMLNAENYEDLICACAFFAPESPFCLDVQYLLCEAFTQAGQQYASALSVAQQEIVSFLKRFNKVETLLFSDGQAFARDITKDFLADLTTQSQMDNSSNSGNTEDIVALIRAEYAEDIAKKDFAAAMLKIHKKANTLQGADLLKMQLEEIRLLLRAKRVEAAVALAITVETSIDFYHLEEWNVELAEEALSVLRATWKAQTSSEKNSEKLVQITMRLYRLNPTTAFL